jgi:hypothetical protein
MMTPGQMEAGKLITSRFALNLEGLEMDGRGFGWQWLKADETLAIVDGRVKVTIGDFIGILMSMCWGLVLDLAEALEEEPTELIQKLALSLALKDPTLPLHDESP